MTKAAWWVGVSQYKCCIVTVDRQLRRWARAGRAGNRLGVQATGWALGVLALGAGRVGAGRAGRARGACVLGARARCRASGRAGVGSSDARGARGGERQAQAGARWAAGWAACARLVCAAGPSWVFWCT